MDKEKKALKDIRGRIRQYSDQSFEFTPFGKGEPVYEEQHKFKNGITESKTRGQNPKRVVRIPLDTDTPDIYDACVRKLDEAYPAPELKPREKRPTCTLVDGPNLWVVHDRKAGHLQIEMKVRVSGDTIKMQKELFNLFTQINSCLAINKTIFRPVLN